MAPGTSVHTGTAARSPAKPASNSSPGIARKVPVAYTRLCYRPSSDPPTELSPLAPTSRPGYRTQLRSAGRVIAPSSDPPAGLSPPVPIRRPGYRPQFRSAGRVIAPSSDPPAGLSPPVPIRRPGYRPQLRSAGPVIAPSSGQRTGLSHPAPVSRPGYRTQLRDIASPVPSPLRSQPFHRFRQRPPGEDHRFPGGASHGVLQRPVVAQAVQPDDVRLAKARGQPLLYPVVGIRPTPPRSRTGIHPAPAGGHLLPGAVRGSASPRWPPEAWRPGASRRRSAPPSRAPAVRQSPGRGRCRGWPRHRPAGSG